MIFSKLNTDLKNFADTTQHLLPAMVAIKMIKNLSKDLKNDPVYYENFLKKIAPVSSTSSYAIQLKTELESLRVVHFGEKSNWSNRLLPVFIALSMLFLFYGLYLRKQLSSSKKSKPEKALISLEILSKKEREVFDLLADGKSNKEIAQSLFIETSTVKSHVNKIFQKLNIQSRKEVINWSNPPKS